jgi:hypothetical protein
MEEAPVPVEEVGGQEAGATLPGIVEGPHHTRQSEVLHVVDLDRDPMIAVEWKHFSERLDPSIIFISPSTLPVSFDTPTSKCLERRGHIYIYIYI